MATARKHQINIENTPYYHCISRCVRQAFLCGDDKFSGRNYSHRRQWVVDRLSRLASVFAIDICAYSVMHTHYHLILRIDALKAKKWTTDEVIQRWSQLFKGDGIMQLYIQGAVLTESEIQALYKKAEVWRAHLMNISWFMRCLNQSIAQMANKEDGCKGRFWEGRFKSQALLDEQALLAAMVYVDLNPIRAGICDNLENSEFTSIAQRLREYARPESDSRDLSCAESGHAVYSQSENSQMEKIKPSFKPPSLNPSLYPSTLKARRIFLAPFGHNQQNQNTISYNLEDYFELTKWTGRIIRDDNKSYIDESEPKIIEKLGISHDTWLETIGNFSDHFYTFVGPKEILAKICQKQNKKWLGGINLCRNLFHHLNPISTSISQ